MTTATSFAEDLILLALDENGRLSGVSHMRFETALAGAILIDLAFMNRIDTDLEHLLLIDGKQTGDALLDRVLDLLGQYPNSQDTAYWIQEIRYQLGDLKDYLLGRLAARGILRLEEHKTLGVIRQKRYHLLDGGPVKEIRERIRETILKEEIPDPRDVVFISLLTAANLIDRLFTKPEITRALGRIEQISQMDLIGQAVYKTILEEICIPISY